MSITRKLLLTSEIIFYKYPHFLTNVIAMLIRQAYKIRRFGPTCPHCSLRMVIGWGPPTRTGLWVDQIRAGERKIAAYSRDNNETYLQHPNLLGSTTQDTDHLGTGPRTCCGTPGVSYGKRQVVHGSTSGRRFRAGDGDFKGAWFRTYDDLAGRWTSPDPLAGDITNPQSLNWYAYVLNNPTSNVDPLGLDGM